LIEKLSRWQVYLISVRYTSSAVSIGSSIFLVNFWVKSFDIVWEGDIDNRTKVDEGMIRA